ncbi:MAG: hypothetical protein K2W96_13460, partial [Gemmataceae bacterium]|nr:hypothetical protein [Gemmataceae bacterium]
MRSMIHKAAALVACAALLASGCVTAPTCGTGCGPQACGAGGCAGSDGMTKPLYDRCWPERYTSLAKREVNHAFAPQVLNGHVLDQTIWNEHFDAGSPRLNAMGQAELQRIARRRPCPDRNVYLATSWDLPYDPACPDRYCGARQELDVARKAEVVKYLIAMNCGRGNDFEVLVHDPSNPSIHSAGIANSIIQQQARFRG